LTDTLGAVFAALADPTRREMLSRMLQDGTTSVPTLTATLPISRQAVAKHLTALDNAGLVQRMPTSGREVRYELRPRALGPAAAWIAAADSAWETRLARLKKALENPRD
jgi:DNA-binding transcriptional ArsR family regulator